MAVIEASGLRRSFQAEPDLPCYRNVHLALRSTSKDRQALVTPGYPWQATEPVPGDAPSARWEVEVTVRRGDDGLDFGGPFVAATAPTVTSAWSGATSGPRAPSGSSAVPS